MIDARHKLAGLIRRVIEDEADKDEREAEQGHLWQQAQLRDTTLPRARYILEQQQAILPETPFNRGVLRATTEYVHARETRPEEPEPEIAGASADATRDISPALAVPDTTRLAKVLDTARDLPGWRNAMKPLPKPATWREALKLARVIGEYATGEINKEEAERRINEVHQGTSDPTAAAATTPTAEFPGPPQTAAPAQGGARTPRAAPRWRWCQARPRTHGRGR